MSIGTAPREPWVCARAAKSSVHCAGEATRDDKPPMAAMKLIEGEGDVCGRARRGARPDREMTPLGPGAGEGHA